MNHMLKHRRRLVAVEVVKRLVQPFAYVHLVFSSWCNAPGPGQTEPEAMHQYFLLLFHLSEPLSGSYLGAVPCLPWLIRWCTFLSLVANVNLSATVLKPT